MIGRFIRQLKLEYKIWEFEIKTKDLRPLDYVIQFGELLKTLPPHVIDHNVIVDMRVQSFCPNINELISHLKIVSNTMSTLHEIYLRDDQRTQEIGAWEWYTKNTPSEITDYDNYVRNKLIKHIDSIKFNYDADSALWAREVNQRRSYPIQTDLKMYLKILNKSMRAV